MDQITTLEGPVDRVDGALVLQIPLEYGGAALADSARGISKIQGEDLIITIPDWLAEKLGITERVTVIVDNRGGKFNITLAAQP
jgi:hypothetical protein